LDLSDPWARPHEALRLQLRREALREISPGHELAGLELTCIAYCSCNLSVFACDDGTFALVRLTWRADERPPWPITTRVFSYETLRLAMEEHRHERWQRLDSA